VRWFDTLRLRFRSLFRRRQIDAELEREMQFHLDQQIEENLAAGLSPAEAQRAARRTLGSLTRLREECREARGLLVLDDGRRDLVLALRSFRRSPTFTAAVVVTLGLGIGATTAIYSAIDAAFLRELPLADPDALVQLRSVTVPVDPGRFRPAGASEGTPVVRRQRRPDVIDLADMRDVFARSAVHATGALNLGSGPEPRRVLTTFVTADFFDTLGRGAALGRVFHAGDAREREPRVVLSDGLWRTQFGAAPSVIGNTVILDERVYEVIGVMPRDFRFPAEADLWLPLAVPVPVDLLSTAFRNYLPTQVVARLAPGVTPQRARERLDALEEQLRPPGAWVAPALLPSVMPLQQWLVGDRRTTLLVLMASAALVLLIACANAATLLRARAAARRRELGTHMALGATRRRLFRRLLAESLVLATAGAVLGLGIAFASQSALAALLPPALMGLSPLRIDWRVLGFALALTGSTTLLFGLWPSIAASRVRADEALGGIRGEGVTMTTGTGSALVVVQIALACVLVVGAGLMLSSLYRLLEAPTGMQIDRVVTARLNLPSASYPNRETLTTFVTSVVERLAAAPGVEAAAAINALPYAQEASIRLRVDARANAADPVLQRPFAPYLVVSPDYFRVMGIPLVSGRTLAWTDSRQVPVAVINRTLARQLGGEGAILGSQITFGDPRTVVGIVEDARIADLATPVGPQVYLPIQEQPQQYLSLVVRSREPDAAAARVAQIRDAVRASDRTLPIYATEPLDVVLASTVVPRRVNTMLLTTFGALALVLAVIGIYGVLAYSVGQRTREIGIRMALGARPTAMVELVVRQGLMLACIGVTIGLIGAAAATRYMEGMLHGVQPRDPLTFASVGLGFLAVAIAASCLPARQAATVDPLTTLRAE
jgi:predicted permease